MAGEQPGKRVTINAAFLQEIKEDHQHLKELLEQLRTLTEVPQVLSNHGQQFVNLLGSLCDQLAFHFTLEEAYGYFEEALDSKPHLESQAGLLKGQHAELFVLARDLADAAAQLDFSSDSKAEKIARRFRVFDQALRDHESAELNLILAALEDDLGVGD